MKNIRKYMNIHSESGMTIVEMLVAMLISGILVTLTFQFFASQATSFNEKRQTSELQQEVRWAMQFVSDHTKLAGNGVPSTCGWPAIEAINGVSGDPDSLTILGCFRSLSVTTTQVWGSAGSQEKLDDTSEIEIGDLGVISDGTFSEIFMITDKTDEYVWHDTYLPWNDDTQLDHSYNAGSTIQILTYYTFFVATDDEGHTNLMLKHQAYEPQILLGDVDDFQVKFQMKDNSWIDEPDEDEISDIRVIDITIVARTPNPIPNYIDSIYGDAYKRIELRSKVIPKNIIS